MKLGKFMPTQPLRGWGGLLRQSLFPPSSTSSPDRSTLRRDRHCGKRSTRSERPAQSRGPLPRPSLLPPVIPPTHLRLNNWADKANGRNSECRAMQNPSIGPFNQESPPGCRSWLLQRPRRSSSKDAPLWITMWTLTLAIFTAMKWATLAASPFIFQGPTWKNLGYLFAWPGMDVTAFLGPRDMARKPKLREWAFAVAKICLGLSLVYAAAPAMLTWSPLTAAWLGTIGIAFILLFGLFDVLSLAWRAAGVDAKPIMRCPVCSVSLSEYWGRRWNLAFRDFAHKFVFRAARPTFGSTGAMMAVFLFSGVVHDIVISGSTRTGWGGPTLFFLIQAVGILVERSRLGRRIGLGQGMLGWAFCVAVLCVSAPLNFTSAFMERVILPTLAAVEAV